MSRQPLSSFIRSYVERHADALPLTTPEDDVDQFRADLDVLYADIEGWLSDSIDADDVRIARISVEITEATTGAYEIDALRIEIGDSAVIEITPVGRFIIGAKGRADLGLVGSNDPSYRLVLLPDQSGQTRWTMTSRARGMTPTVLDQGCFENAFRSLLDAQHSEASSLGAGF